MEIFSTTELRGDCDYAGSQSIDRAMTAAEAQGHDVAILFMVNHGSSGGVILNPVIAEVG